MYPTITIQTKGKSFFFPAIAVFKVKRYRFYFIKHIPEEGPTKWKLSLIPILLNIHNSTSFDLWVKYQSLFKLKDISGFFFLTTWNWKLRTNIGMAGRKKVSGRVEGKVSDLLLSISHFCQICCRIPPASSAEGHTVLSFSQPENDKIKALIFWRENRLRGRALLWGQTILPFVTWQDCRV